MSNVGGRLKKYLDHRNAGQGLGFDVLDVVYGGGQTALVDRRDALTDFLSRQPGIVPHDADHRNVDFREDVGRHLGEHERSSEKNQQRHDQEGVGPAQRNLNDPHYLHNRKMNEVWRDRFSRIGRGRSYAAGRSSASAPP